MNDLKALSHIEDKFIKLVEGADSAEQLERLRVEAFGKKGEFTALFQRLGSMNAKERPTFGKSLNQTKQKIQTLLEAKIAKVANEAEAKALSTQKADITLNLSNFKGGKLHPITAVTEEITSIFLKMGFAIATGPQIEDDFHNFSGLNIPDDHPARQMHDTFYLKDSDLLLRTHTSSVQLRYLKKHGAPCCIIAPGRVYRADSDQTHTPMFHQIEGLCLGTNYTMAHLKGCLERFIAEFFGDGFETRLRPSYFPFTEPSAELDVKQPNKGWMEVLGCGMVHPNVLKTCGINPSNIGGFAFGLGVERLAMLKYNIQDLRQFFGCNNQWLKHYGINVEQVL